MSTIRMKVGDTAPPAEAFLKSASGAAYDLTGATSLKFKARRNGQVTINGNAQIPSGALPTDGHLIYNWNPLDTAAGQVGQHECKWEVTDVNGKVSSWPTLWEEPLRLQVSF